MAIQFVGGESNLKLNWTRICLNIKQNVGQSHVSVKI